MTEPNASVDYLLGGIDSVTKSFLSQTYPGLADAVSTPVYLASVIYWALYGYKIYTGTSPFNWTDVTKKAVATVCIAGMLSWGGLATTLYDAFVSLMDGGASTIMAGSPTSSMLDALYKNIQTIAATLMKASLSSIGTIVQGFVLGTVNCLLLAIAVCYMLFAKVGLAITMVLAPLFVSFALFDSTRQWFMNWLSKMLTFAILYILVIGIVRFGFTAFSDVIDLATKSSGLIADEISTATLGLFLIVELILIVMMLGARGWAGSLAGGASSGSGFLVMAIRSVVTKGLIK